MNRNCLIIIILFSLITSFLGSCQNFSDSASKPESGSASFGDQGNGMYLNPVFPGDFPDPSVLRDGKDYYMTHTSHNNYPGFVIYHSRDLVSWTPIGHALDKDIGTVWAPDLIKFDNKFYIYFPAWSTGTIMVTTADLITGPWSEPVDLKLRYIDPGHIADEQGNRYLYLSEGYVVKLAADGLSTDGEVIKSYDGWKYPDDWITECFCLESPKLFKKDKYYYLIAAQGGTSGPATSHMAVAARSESVLGPWENSPYNPVLHTFSPNEEWWSKGHATLVDTPEDDWYIIYHAYQKNQRTRGRMTLMEPVEWTADGWLRVPDGSNPAKEIHIPSGEKVESVFHKETNGFEEDFALYRWQTYGGFDKSHLLIQDNRMFMRAKGISIPNSEPLLYQPIHDAYQVTVDLEIPPGADANAGLMIFYGEDFYHGVGIGKEGIEVFSSKFNNRPVKPLDRKIIQLKMVNIQDNLAFFYRLNESEYWSKIWDGMDVSIYNTNNFGGFKNLRIGLFSYGEGNVMFSNFKYKRI